MQSKAVDISWVPFLWSVTERTHLVVTELEVVIGPQFMKMVHNLLLEPVVGNRAQSRSLALADAQRLMQNGVKSLKLRDGIKVEVLLNDWWWFGTRSFSCGCCCG